MRYSIEPKDRIYGKGYGFLSFTKNMSTHVSHKQSQKILDTAKKSTTDAIKTTSKRAIQKTAEATGDLVGNKIGDKSTGIASPKEVSASTELHSKNSSKQLPNEEDVEMTTYKKGYMSPEERQQITDELRLVPKKDAYFGKLLVN